MKKLVSITMVLLLLSGVVFAGGASEKTTAAPAATTTEKAATSGVPAHKAELVIGSAADINNLDLQAQQDQINNIVLKTTHQTLVYFTNKGTFEPNLATSWEFNLNSAYF